MTILYHYTNPIALAAILSQQSLRPSLRRNRRRNARYGDGQYLTDVPPGTLGGSDLSNVLVRNDVQAERFSHYLAIDVTGLNVVKGRDHVFVIPNTNNLDLEGRIVQAGANSDDLSQN